jgi:hypothetical protein
MTLKTDLINKVNKSKTKRKSNKTHSKYNRKEL